MEKSSCLIVFETSMEKRYAQMAEIHGFTLYTVGLTNDWKNSFKDNLKIRINSKELLNQKRVLLIQFLKNNDFKNIYLSNAEGYISKNFIPVIRKEILSAKVIAFQHGLFPLKYSVYKEISRNLINSIVHKFTGIFPLGSGFGGITLDRYYVYSEREKQFLVSKRGWSPDAITVDIKFIKPEVYQQFVFLKKNKNEETLTAVFLLQGLFVAGLCSEDYELKLIEETINYLSKKYNRVLIKEHPACEGRLKKINLPENVSEESNLFESFSKADDAYSFFSTALIDAKVFNLKTVGISSKNIKVGKEIYDNFDLNIDFEKDIAS
ncbi:polysialyltransferase family glycosyltransferase [Maribacter spongiicola]|uniref:polysialyltransferase family glycosyltransferase n=1 Tax=Maribacter spongiicola TaxID=1206753 RepID=UPI003F99A6B9